MLNNPQINPKIAQIVRMFASASDQMAFLKQNFGNNPQFNTLVNLLEGKTPEQKEQVMRNYLTEQGINPDLIINTARQFGLK